MSKKENTILFEILQNEKEANSFGARIVNASGEIANTHAGLITVAMAAVTVVALSSKRPVNEVLMDMIEMTPDTKVAEAVSGQPTWAN